MRDKLHSIIVTLRIKDLLAIFGLCFILISFFATTSNDLILFLNNSFYSCILLTALITVLTFICWFALAYHFKKNDLPICYSLITLAPIVLLLFWDAQDNSITIWIPLFTILLTMLFFLIILTKKKDKTQKLKLNIKRIIAIFAVAYFVILSYITIYRYNNFIVFNPKDFAHYNQIFWNTLQGNVFESFRYGSNFTCHNSPFYFLLVPIYYIFPHPLTLMISKTLLLALSTIPFYLIAKKLGLKHSIIPMALTFLLYPYLITQNFAPPHEICYAPFFILFTYYFFRIKRLAPFIVFLILSLLIKEHIALIAIMFGIFALFEKRQLEWIFIPILLGIAWAIFSLYIIDHFKEFYRIRDTSSWLLSNFKHKLLEQNELSINSRIISLFSNSNVTSFYRLKLGMTLFSSLCILPVLLSPITILGIPELALNLIADRPAVFAPIRHYNIIISCFLLIAAMEGINRLANSKIAIRLKLSPKTFRLLSSILILSSTIIHSQTWLWFIRSPANKQYVNTAKEVISQIPKDAYVTVPENLAVHVSNRKRYSILKEETYSIIENKPADYIIVNNCDMKLLDEKTKNKYFSVFQKNNLRILKKNERK